MTKDNKIVPPHRAFMKFRMADLAKRSPRQPDFVYLSGRTSTGICFLNGEALSLPASSDKLDADTSGLTKSKTPNKRNKGSIFWIANINDFCKGSDLRTKNLRTNNLRTSKRRRRGSSELAAIVDVRAGYMRTSSVDRRKFTVSPPPDSGSYEQSLAEEVSVSSRVTGTLYKVRSSRQRSLNLKPRRRETHIEIVNEVPDDIIIPAIRRSKERIDYDFDLLYNLTRDKRGKAGHRHLPCLSAVEAHGTAGCKPGTFTSQRFP